MRQALLALQHADSAFPSGGFAFSNGFEGLLAEGRSLDADGLAQSLEMVLRGRWATTDRIAVARAHGAGPDLEAVIAIDQEVEAAALCEPMRLGSRRNGAALIAAHARIGTAGARDLRDAVRGGRACGHLPVAQGFLWRAVGIDAPAAIAMSGYTTAAALTTAAIRLGQIGAIQAQRVLADALAIVAERADDPLDAAAPLTAFLPFLDIAAVRHARADVRLFVN